MGEEESKYFMVSAEYIMIKREREIWIKSMRCKFNTVGRIVQKIMHHLHPMTNNVFFILSEYRSLKISDS